MRFLLRSSSCWPPTARARSKAFLDFLGSLSQRECKKPELTSNKQTFKNLLDTVSTADTKVEGFLCNEIVQSTRHFGNVLGCAQVGAFDLETSIQFVKDSEGTESEPPLLKALRSHANGVLLLQTAGDVMSKRGTEVAVDQKIKELKRVMSKVNTDSQNFEELSAHIKDLPTDFQELYKMTKGKKNAPQGKVSVDEACKH